MGYAWKTLSPQRYQRLLNRAIRLVEARTTPPRKFKKGRDPRVVYARAVVFSLLRKRGYSYPGIGRGAGRHHTSIYHAVCRKPIYREILRKKCQAS